MSNHWWTAPLVLFLAIVGAVVVIVLGSSLLSTSPTAPVSSPIAVPVPAAPISPPVVVTTPAPAPSVVISAGCPVGTTVQADGTCLKPAVCPAGTTPNAAGVCEKPVVVVAPAPSPVVTVTPASRVDFGPLFSWSAGEGTFIHNIALQTGLPDWLVVVLVIALIVAAVWLLFTERRVLGALVLIAGVLIIAVIAIPYLMGAINTGIYIGTTRTYSFTECMANPGPCIGKTIPVQLDGTVRAVNPDSLQVTIVPESGCVEVYGPSGAKLGDACAGRTTVLNGIISAAQTPGDVRTAYVTWCPLSSRSFGIGRCS
jgi:hypothetical protein